MTHRHVLCQIWNRSVVKLLIVLKGLAAFVAWRSAYWGYQVIWQWWWWCCEFSVASGKAKSKDNNSIYWGGSAQYLSSSNHDYNYCDDNCCGRQHFLPGVVHEQAPYSYVLVQVVLVWKRHFQILRRTFEATENSNVLSACGVKYVFFPIHSEEIVQLPFLAMCKSPWST